MSVFGNIGKALKKAVSNPLQPITHTVGKAAGITANLNNGVHVDPSRILTDVMAAGGNPAAIAAVVGNTVNAVSPNSTLGHLGGTVGKYAPLVAGATGGLSALSKIPGAGTVGSALSHVPGATSVGKLLGLTGAAGAAGGAGGDIPATMPGFDYNVDTGVLTPAAAAASAAGSGGGGGIVQSIEHLLTGGSNDQGGTDPSLLGRIGSFITGNNGMNALGVAQGVNTALQQKKANDLANSALDTVKSSYTERAPLRAAGVAGLLNPKTPDLTDLRTTMQTGNPYAGRAPMSVNALAGAS